MFKDESATFIKELAFRCSDEAHLQSVLRAVKELRKQFTDKQVCRRGAGTGV
jgi:hypothetical protein